MLKTLMALLAVICLFTVAGVSVNSGNAISLRFVLVVLFYGAIGISLGNWIYMWPFLQGKKFKVLGHDGNIRKVVTGILLVVWFSPAVYVLFSSGVVEARSVMVDLVLVGCCLIMLLLSLAVRETVRERMGIKKG